MNSTLRLVINFVLFQLGWLVCIFLGSWYGLVFTAFALCLHSRFVMASKKEWQIIGAIALIGVAWDSLIMHLGLLLFDEPFGALIPIWLMCLWVLFAMTLSHSMYWLRENLVLGSLFGALFAPLSYYAGVQLGPAYFPENSVTSLVVISIGWLVFMPLALIWAGKVHEATDSDSSFDSADWKLRS